MRQVFFFRIMVAVCLCSLLVPGLAVPSRADPGTGYWNFSPNTPVDLLAANATGQAGTPDNQSILPGDPLYDLKLSFEQIDLTFTPNATVRIEKSMHYTENRLREADIALQENRTGSEGKALAQYSEDLNATLRLIAKERRNISAYLHVHNILAQHLAVLNQTISRHPGSTDLLAAYNRTSALVAERHEENSTFVRHALPAPIRQPVQENRSSLP